MLSLNDRIADLQAKLDSIDKLRGTDKWSIGYQNAWCFLFQRLQKLKASQNRQEND